jgi:ParB-like chromosome segregation protein Spo0J
MNPITVKISEVKSNPNNPRIIKDDKFQKLVKSIKEFPEMLNIRPIVVNADMVVLGGNMRLKACKEAGLKEVAIIKAEDLTEDQQKQFIIKDNVGYGEWDWEGLANQWDENELAEWGLDIPSFNVSKDLDYSILDEADVSEQLSEMTSNVKKAIQIEFEAEHYEEASELVKFWREQGLYIGGFLMEKLKEEKERL